MMEITTFWIVYETGIPSAWLDLSTDKHVHWPNISFKEYERVNEESEVQKN